METTSKQSQREQLSPSQRFGELVAIFVMFLFMGFFVYHLVANTGFFTAAFGPWEMFFFFGPMLVALTPPLMRAITGARQPARPLEALTNAFMAVGALWLLMVFPFEFAHLADALPAGLRFTLAWVNNDIGRILLILQAIVCPVVALVMMWQYVAHRIHATGSAPGSPVAT
jgi:hypothetical protein